MLLKFLLLTKSSPDYMPSLTIYESRTFCFFEHIELSKIIVLLFIDTGKTLSRYLGENIGKV